MDIIYKNNDGKTLADLLEEKTSEEQAQRNAQVEMMRKAEEKRGDRLRCFLTADDMISYVLDGGRMTLNGVGEQDDFIYYDKQHDLIVHHIHNYDDCSGRYILDVRESSVREFTEWAKECERRNLEQERPDKYFNPYWSPSEVFDD